jgi:hypothetical protein
VTTHSQESSLARQQLTNSPPKIASTRQLQRNQEGIPTKERLIVTAIAAIALTYLAGAVTLLYLLAALWPPAGSAQSTITFFHSTWTLNAEVRLIWLVVTASALGSFIHTATSFVTYAGNRDLAPCWLGWYILRPAIGAALALIFYFAIRGGIFAGSAPEQNLNPFGIAALSGMVGMFSKQATEKLRKVFDTIFS